MSEIIKNITVVLCVALCLAGGIWAWWLENGPRRDEKVPEQKPEERAKAGTDSAQKN